MALAQREGEAAALDVDALQHVGPELQFGIVADQAGVAVDREIADVPRLGDQRADRPAGRADPAAAGGEIDDEGGRRRRRGVGRRRVGAGRPARRPEKAAPQARQEGAAGDAAVPSTPSPGAERHPMSATRRRPEAGKDGGVGCPKDAACGGDLRHPPPSRHDSEDAAGGAGRSRSRPTAHGPPAAGSRRSAAPANSPVARCRSSKAWDRAISPAACRRRASSAGCSKGGRCGSSGSAPGSARGSGDHRDGRMGRAAMGVDPVPGRVVVEQQPGEAAGMRLHDPPPLGDVIVEERHRAAGSSRGPIRRRPVGGAVARPGVTVLQPRQVGVVAEDRGPRAGLPDHPGGQPSEHAGFDHEVRFQRPHRHVELKGAVESAAAPALPDGGGRDQRPERPDLFEDVAVRRRGRRQRGRVPGWPPRIRAASPPRAREVGRWLQSGAAGTRS